MRVQVEGHWYCPACHHKNTTNKIPVPGVALRCEVCRSSHIVSKVES